MNQQSARNFLIVVVLLVAVLAYVFADRYPTVDDCAEVAAGYQQRGYFDAATAGEFSRECSAAADREARQQVVNRMNDEASIAASTR